MRPVQDLVLTKYKREHIGDAALLEVEKDAYDSSGDVPRTPYAPTSAVVTRREVGLTSEMWNLSLELEAFLERPWQIKEVVEKNTFMTGAQMIYLMISLKNACKPSNSLRILNFPAGITVAQRRRTKAVIRADSIHPVIQKARKILAEQLTTRFLTTPPSEARLVQLCMSKQANARKVSCCNVPTIMEGAG